MKTSLFLTVGSLICLLVTQANAGVVNIREIKGETQIVVANEFQRLLPNEAQSNELLKTFEEMGISAALATNEREFRSLPTVTTSSQCLELKELEESKCAVSVKEIPLFDEKESYLVCAVTSVYKCTTVPAGKPLDFQF